MKIITKKDLIKKLNDVKGTSIISIISETSPSLRKTDNPYWDKATKTWSLKKVSYVNGMIGWNYGNSVNNQRKREGKSDNFKPHERVWGVRLENSPLVEHKNTYYLEMKIENAYKTIYVDADGNEVDKDSLEPFMSKSSSSRQGTDKEIILRDYKIDSISEIKLGGELYKVA